MQLLANKYFIGIDPSITNTAVCILNIRGEIADVYNYKLDEEPLSKEILGYTWLRLGHIKEFVIQSIHKTIPVDTKRIHICYEDYSFDSTNKAFTTGELGGVLKLGLTEEFCQPLLIEPKVLKKFATNCGDSTKKEIINQALLESEFLSKIPKDKLTDDICDAYFLAKMGWYLNSPKEAQNHEVNRENLRRRLEYILELKERKINNDRKRKSCSRRKRRTK